jgi:hypothetical protein
MTINYRRPVCSLQLASRALYWGELNGGEERGGVVADLAG